MFFCFLFGIECEILWILILPVKSSQLSWLSLCILLPRLKYIQDLFIFLLKVFNLFLNHFHLRDPSLLTYNDFIWFSDKIENKETIIIEEKIHWVLPLILKDIFPSVILGRRGKLFHTFSTPINWNLNRNLISDGFRRVKKIILWSLRLTGTLVCYAWTADSDV